MILALDVHYRDDRARIVGAEFANWTDERAGKHVIKYREGIPAYVSGEFYRRELPCLLDIIRDYRPVGLDCIIIDGFVTLDNEGKKGLGAHLYDALHQRVPVIGVAKTSFHNHTQGVRPVLRGESRQPLYVTTAGYDLDEAADKVHRMAGAFRIPAILKELDRLTKAG